MCCIEEKTSDIVRTFRCHLVIRRPGHCARFVTPLVWHFVTKCTALKFAEPWMSNHFSELRDHNYVSPAMYPECSTKDWSCWLNPRENGAEVVQGLGGVTTSPTLFGPVLVWSQQNYPKLLLTVRYSKSSLGCCPATLPRRKTGMKTNEMNNIYII